MNFAFRRITTGVNDAGKSQVVEDLSLPAMGPSGIEIWRDRAAHFVADNNGANSPYRFYPPDGEFIVRVVPLAPDDGCMSSVDLARAADNFFELQNISDCRIDTSRHPFMHRTPTIDYAMLLSGKVALLLDVGEPVELQPMDMVVQRMTNHMWLNTGTETACLLVVMIGANTAHSAR